MKQDDVERIIASIQANIISQDYAKSEEAHTDAYWKHELDMAYIRGYKQGQKSKWIGLSEEEKLSLEIQGSKSDVLLAELVESWLKEKNT